MGEKIGVGGFSSVYLSTKFEDPNTTYVLKKLEMVDITDLDQVQIEAKQIRNLNHKHIVSYEDDFIHQEKTGLEPKYYFCLVMEHC
jgi:serine/threonine protein kinase